MLGTCSVYIQSRWCLECAQFTSRADGAWMVLSQHSHHRLWVLGTCSIVQTFRVKTGEEQEALNMLNNRNGVPVMAWVYKKLIQVFT